MLVRILAIAMLGSCPLLDKPRRPTAAFFPALADSLQTPAAAPTQYAWLAPGRYAARNSLAARFPAPAGYQRTAVAPGSFGHWLRHLPLLPPGTPVRLYNGQLKSRQDVHAAVLDLDVGQQDLQQCADAVIRLRAEYLFSQDPARIHFQLTSGHDIAFPQWCAGTGFRVVGADDVQPASKVAEAPTHAALRRYLVQIFSYAGTRSLARELQPVPLAQVQPGDVLIQAGSPGHAVLVLDVAVQPTTGQRVALLAQSYMPAQQVHVLKAGPQPGAGAWFALDPARLQVHTPEWTFAREELGRF
ncbi:DUF4846 domain-containing protein [Hymenobacter weizhouensis]|uniref:DUF4846 domain-containing protein n=1 Tax=Hymenobacter sp. YIM 151500-1 TaxID=2987689 RepID=UPI002226CF3E|nr:DUF4846 domain-containing protein [Hymenobacter sp. YIM 151500-1]UYZ64447.1 DUF4846 domain-containing protein [Hymenobacter sp. YIM 151500-1]